MKVCTYLVQIGCLRNLNERVELMIPIEDKRLKERIKKYFTDLYLDDTLKLIYESRWFNM